MNLANQSYQTSVQYLFGGDAWADPASGDPGVYDLLKSKAG